MRQILFRGKRMEDGAWVSGDLIHWEDERVGIRYEVPEAEFRPTRMSEVNPETVGQFAGKTDLRGKPIFEGDVVLVQYDDELNVTRVVWNEKQSAWCIDFYYKGEVISNSSMDDLFSQDDMCVIGNIYDNPELLEEAKSS